MITSNFCKTEAGTIQSQKQGFGLQLNPKYAIV